MCRLRPWLIEVNSSPSMARDTHVDRQVRMDTHCHPLVGPDQVKWLEFKAQQDHGIIFYGKRIVEYPRKLKGGMVLRRER